MLGCRTLERQKIPYGVRSKTPSHSAFKKGKRRHDLTRIITATGFLLATSMKQSYRSELRVYMIGQKRHMERRCSETPLAPRSNWCWRALSVHREIWRRHGILLRRRFK